MTDPPYISARTARIAIDAKESKPKITAAETIIATVAATELFSVLFEEGQLIRLTSEKIPINHFFTFSKKTSHLYILYVI